MAYGGTAQTYCLWTQDGEPFKEGAVQYIYVLHPITKARKKVRWYTDKKHAELMPNKKDYGPFYKVFGFEAADDYILCVKKTAITDEEEAEYFASKWRFGMFFGGVWYAPKGTELPPIKKQDKISKVSWPTFREAGQKHSKELGMVSEAESPWFKELTA